MLAGATLGGTGIIGGDVMIANGATLAPGQSPGTLTINGDLLLAANAILDFEFGAANVVGGALNDLLEVGDALVLDGTLNISVSPGGSFDGGIYRVINYRGALTDNGLVVGRTPAASGVFIQTSTPNQVNLVSTAGLTLNFWDGAAGPKFNGMVNGGDGSWQNGTGNNHWADASGVANVAYADGAFAVFMAAPGTVTVDNSLGAVTTSGMQFASNGYRIVGDALTLTGAQATIRVGDGTARGAGQTSTIAAALNGSTRLVKTDLGTLILSGANGYTGGTAINGGTLQIASDANLGAAAAGLGFNGGTLRSTADIATTRAVDLVGNGSFLTDTGTSLTLGGAVSGAGLLAKDGGGRLILTGANSYTGGTTISAGTLQIGDGGTAGSITGDVTNNATLAFNRSNAVTLSGVISGSGAVNQIGTVATTLTGANRYTGTTTVSSGTLMVNGDQSASTGLTGVLAGATLGGTGIIGGDVMVANGATLAPGQIAGTLTINGDYTGLGGRLQLEVHLGGGASPSDLLVVRGATSGQTTVGVVNLAGTGAGHPNGIKIIDVGGASDGQFTLAGDYVFRGQAAIIAGAFGYTLEKHGVSTPTDGDWYLRSQRSDAAGGPVDPDGALYQPGVPVYEAYADALLTLNALPTWRERIAGRQWTPTKPGTGVWGRAEVARHRHNANVSASLTDVDTELRSVQAGLDHALVVSRHGALFGGITGHYRQADTNASSIFGNGRLKIDGYGLGATLNWNDSSDFYVDAQAEFSWYRSDLRSQTLGLLVDGSHGKGRAFSLEAGKRLSVGDFTITPQAQLVYSHVDFDRFTDPHGAVVAIDRGESLEGRWGVSFHRSIEPNQPTRGRAYGLVNFSYAMLDGTRTDVSGSRIDRRNDRLWGELGVGGNYSWGAVTLYGEVSMTTSLRDFGDSYSLKSQAGIQVRF